MHTHRHKLLLGLFLLAILLPALVYHIPAYFAAADVQYVKAKVLSIQNGSLYADPVTGFLTFHPPYYHLILIPFLWLGVPIDTLLTIIPLLTVSLTILLAYGILRRLFDDDTALVTAMLVPFINQYLGPGYLLLASAFYFSVPVYLAGLWLYLIRPPSLKRDVLTGLLWGIAFLITPVYLFLIGLTLGYELFPARRYRRFGVMAAVFAVTILPFFYQAYTLWQYGLADSTAFSLWRGLPESRWLAYLLSPTDGSLTHWQMVPAWTLMAIGVFAMIRKRKMSSLVIIAAAAYVLTAYAYNYYQYGPRILFFLSLPVVAFAVDYILGVSGKSRLAIVLVAVAVVGVIADHGYRWIDRYRQDDSIYETYYDIAAEMTEHLPRFARPGELVLASTNTYRAYIMPFLPYRGMAASKTADYYQLDAQLALERVKDFNAFVETGAGDKLDLLCDKYHVNFAVVGGKDVDLPGFRMLMHSWETVYRGRIFTILGRPGRR